MMSLRAAPLVAVCLAVVSAGVGLAASDEPELLDYCVIDGPLHVGSGCSFACKGPVVGVYLHTLNGLAPDVTFLSAFGGCPGGVTAQCVGVVACYGYGVAGTLSGCVTSVCLGSSKDVGRCQIWSIADGASGSLTCGAWRLSSWCWPFEEFCVDGPPHMSL